MVNNETLSIIITRLQMTLKELGITNRDLAKYFKCNYQYFSRLFLQQQKKVDIFMISEICEVFLGVPIDALAQTDFNLDVYCRDHFCDYPCHKELLECIDTFHTLPIFYGGSEKENKKEYSRLINKHFLAAFKHVIGFDYLNYQIESIFMEENKRIGIKTPFLQLCISTPYNKQGYRIMMRLAVIQDYEKRNSRLSLNCETKFSKDSAYKKKIQALKNIDEIFEAEDAIKIHDKKFHSLRYPKKPDNDVEKRLFALDVSEILYKEYFDNYSELYEDILFLIKVFCSYERYMKIEQNDEVENMKRKVAINTAILAPLALLPTVGPVGAATSSAIAITAHNIVNGEKNKKYKHCLFCGCKLPRVAKYCLECGKSQKFNIED